MRTLQPDWETYTTTTRNRTSEPRIRINKNKILTLTRAAVEQFEVPTDVELLFDRRSKSKVALAFKSEPTDASRRVTPHKPNGSASLNMVKFIEQYMPDLELPYDPKVERQDDKLILSF